MSFEPGENSVVIVGSGGTKVDALVINGVPIIELWPGVPIPPQTSQSPGNLLAVWFAGNGGQVSTQLSSPTVNGGHDCRIFLIGQAADASAEAEMLFHARRQMTWQSTFGQNDGMKLDVLNGGVLSVDGALKVRQGANKSIGRATLVAGTVTVNTTKAMNSAEIFVTRRVAAGTVGDLRIGAIVDGTSFVINSASATDTSQVSWWIVDAA